MDVNTTTTTPSAAAAAPVPKLGLNPRAQEVTQPATGEINSSIATKAAAGSPPALLKADVTSDEKKTDEPDVKSPVEVLGMKTEDRIKALEKNLAEQKAEHKKSLSGGFFSWKKAAESAAVESGAAADHKVHRSKSLEGGSDRVLGSSKSFKRIKGLLKGKRKSRKETKDSSLQTSSLSMGDDDSTVEGVDVDDRSVASKTTAESSSPTNKPDLLKVVLLLMDPVTRRFELLQLEFDAQKALVSDVLAQIPVSVTEEALRQKSYTGICGSDGIEMPENKRLADFNKGNEVLVAIPSGLQANDCARLARPILVDEKVVNMLSSSEINVEEWRDHFALTPKKDLSHTDAKDQKENSDQTKHSSNTYESSQKKDTNFQELSSQKPSSGHYQDTNRTEVSSGKSDSGSKTDSSRKEETSGQGEEDSGRKGSWNVKGNWNVKGDSSPKADTHNAGSNNQASGLKKDWNHRSDTDSSPKSDRSPKADSNSKDSSPKADRSQKGDFSYKSDSKRMSDANRKSDSKRKQSTGDRTMAQSGKMQSGINKPKSGISRLLTLAAFALLPVVVELFHLYKSAPIKPGNVVGPGTTLNRCGLRSFMPSCEDAYFTLDRHGTAIYYDADHRALWKIEGGVCDENDDTCKPGLEVRPDGTILIGGRYATHYTALRESSLSPWPFAEPPKLKLKKAHKSYFDKLHKLDATLRLN